MRNKKTSDLTLYALLTALSVVLAYVHVPTPTGFLTLLDVGIYFTAFYLGSRAGGIVGGLSGFIIDLLLGYPQYMIHSLIAHGAQGYLAGFQGAKRTIGLVLSALVMVVWYVLASLSLGQGFGAAMATIFGNIGQSLLGMGLGYLLYRAFRRWGN